jgi:ribosomal protein L40E
LGIEDMRYIICDDCGGYYKLESGESLEDFAECQCGGRLRYAQSFKEIIKDKKAPTIQCIHCGAQNSESAVNCYKCGKKLRRVNRKIKNYYAGGKQSRTSDLNIMDRISFLGVLAGIIFLVLASIIAVMGLAGSIIASNGVDVLRSLGGYLIVFIFVIIASGFIAGYISGSRDYVDGLLNGFMVGLALSVLGALIIMILTMTMDVMMGFIAGLITLSAYVIIYGGLTALGGLVAVWLRNNISYD